jgi:hypothetical protein
VDSGSRCLKRRIGLQDGLLFLSFLSSLCSKHSELDSRVNVSLPPFRPSAALGPHSAFRPHSALGPHSPFRPHSAFGAHSTLGLKSHIRHVTPLLDPPVVVNRRRRQVEIGDWRRQDNSREIAPLLFLWRRREHLRLDDRHLRAHRLLNVRHGPEELDELLEIDRAVVVKLFWGGGGQGQRSQIKTRASRKRCVSQTNIHQYPS